VSLLHFKATLEFEVSICARDERPGEDPGFTVGGYRWLVDCGRDGTSTTWKWVGFASAPPWPLLNALRGFGLMCPHSRSRGRAGDSVTKTSPFNLTERRRAR